MLLLQIQISFIEKQGHEEQEEKMLFPSWNDSAADRFTQSLSLRSTIIVLSVEKPKMMFYKLQCMVQALMKFMYLRENPK